VYKRIICDLQKERRGKNFHFFSICSIPTDGQCYGTGRDLTFSKIMKKKYEWESFHFPYSKLVVNLSKSRKKTKKSKESFQMSIFLLENGNFHVYFVFSQKMMNLLPEE